MADDDVVINVRMELLAAKQQLAGFRKDLTKVGGNSVQAFRYIAQAENEVAKQTEKLQKALGKQPPFQGWALSIMFAGMAIKNAMNQIWASSTKTFQEIMHSTEGTVTAFDMLDGSIKYLGFTVGQALEPVAMFLAPIVMSIANWVSENQTLVTTLFVVGSVLGTMLALIGSTVLAVSGFVQAWALAGPAITSAVTGIVSVLGTIASTIGAPILLVIAVIIAAIIAFVALWKSNFAGIRDFVSETFGIILATIVSVFKNLFGIIEGVFKIFKALFTGDFELLWEGVVQIFKNGLAILLKLLLGLGAVVYNIFAFIINSITSLFANMLTLILGGIKAVIKAANKIPGVKISTSWLDEAKSAVSSLKASAQIGYISGDSIKEDMGGIDQMLGLGKDNASSASSNTTVNNVQNTYNVEIKQTDSWEKIQREMDAASRG